MSKKKISTAVLLPELQATSSQKIKRMSIFRYIPLMAVVLILYNLLSLQYSSPAEAFWANIMTTFTLPSGNEIALTYREGFVTFALFVLFVELIKSTVASNAAITEQILSVLAFIGFLIQFLVSPHAAEPTFFILLNISLIEVLAGFVIIVREARKDIHFGGN